jgi:hypothetical protein
MSRILVALGVLPALLAGVARADTGEGSVRCGPEFHRASETAAGRDTTAWLFGGQCTLAIGFRESLSGFARYAYLRSGELRVDADAPDTSQVWRVGRHDLTAGVAWAPSDAFTPLVMLSGGAVNATQFDRQWRLQTDAGERRIAPSLGDRSAWRPVARADAGWEWRFRDFWSVSGGVFGGWAGTPEFGAGITLAGYRYL